MATGSTICCFNSIGYFSLVVRSTHSHANSFGTLLIVLDGFDEMGRTVDYNTGRREFSELARLVGELSKAILTIHLSSSRTDLRPGEGAGFTWGRVAAAYGRQVAGVVPPALDGQTGLL